MRTSSLRLLPLLLAGCAPVEGVSVERVEINPGVAIPLWLDGAPAGADQRLAPLPPGRDAWIFVHLAVDDGWAPQEVAATLTLEAADGTRYAAEEVALIERGTADWAADPRGGLRYDMELSDFAGFAFSIDGALVQPGAAWGLRVGGRDLAEGALIELPVEPRAPALRLELIPVVLETPSCTAEPDLSEEGMEPLVAYMDAMMPYRELLLETGPEVVWEDDYLDRDAIFTLMAQSRAERGLGPEVYSYGILEPCDTLEQMFPRGGAALLPLEPPDEGTASEWLLGILSRDDGRSFDEHTYEQYVFTHETGHLLGRAHIDCGNPGGPGRDYPNQDGLLHSWGLDPRTGRLLHPELSHDIMAYCHNMWISPYTWARLWERMADQEAWAEGRAQRRARQPGRILLGQLDDGGQARWSVVDSPDAPARGGAGTLHLRGPAGDVTAPAAVSRRPDGDGLVISATLPGGDFDHGYLEHDGARYPLSAEVLR